MAYTTINKSTLYFNDKFYTGTGSNGNAITGVGFQPDFIWIKDRVNAYSHRLYDSVKGVNSALNSDNTAAASQYAQYGQLESIDSDGFTVGQGSSNGAAMNDSGDGHASWNWKAGTTGSGSTGGSGTAKTYNYSVNATAGFSIVKYIGNGSSGQTIPHHLGAVPHFILLKPLDAADHWRVYHNKIHPTAPEEYFLRLQTTDTRGDSNDIWSDTAHTSSVFTVGNNSGVNANDQEFIAYVFTQKTGYSKTGIYSGNSNADGPFVYTGFKPSVIIIKDKDNAENWFIFDNKRPGYNLNANHLNPNSTTTETTSGANSLDIVSNGFKMRATNNGINRNGGEGFLYFAIGQSLVGSNNVPCTAR